MRDVELYRQILGIDSPWSVKAVEVDLPGKEVRVRVERAGDLECPTCGRRGNGYDHVDRRWRHLDTCQLATVLVARVPRVECEEHGVRQVMVPWAEPGSRFTALFEALVIDWLREASISAVAGMLGLSWDEAAGIQDRAVARGLARRKLEVPPTIGVDETSSRRGQRYLTVVSDSVRPHVLWATENRDKAALEGFFDQLSPEQVSRIRQMAMDMWRPYISVAESRLPEGATIVFDKYHVASHLGDAVDKVRRRENRDLLAKEDRTLVGTKYLWLTRRGNLSRPDQIELAALRQKRLRTARATAIKDEAMSLWGYESRGWAERAWKRWLSWALRSRLEPMKAAARMIRSHWDGVINAAISNVTNAMAETVNGKIQWIKRQARGFRNMSRFINAIYFHLGGLDLYPASIGLTHSNA